MTTFIDLGLSEKLLKAIEELGFEYPMPVQEAVIPYLLGGERDVVALAQTGTGKTAAFGLPLLEKLDLQNRNTQALVLSPTRELCVQIAEDMMDFAKHTEGVNIVPVYGGANIRTQMNHLAHGGAHIIVATPGRLLDLMDRGYVHLEDVRNVVMDEADEMLNMGFQEDIDAILEAVPEDRNTLLFSATMPDEIARIAKKYMRNPQEIVIGNRNESTSTVRHIQYTVQSHDKYQTLRRIVDFYPRMYGIVFCRTKAETQEIADRLIREGYNADALHGDLSQIQRDSVMSRFRLRNIKLLVATDVAARGLDVDDLTHIINYTLPDETEVYTHRSGRTGRAGKTGISIAIVTPREAKKIRDIEKVTGKTFEVGTIPTGREICSKQIFSLMDRIEKVDVDEDEIASLLPGVFSRLEWMDKEELIKKMVSLEFNRIISYYKDKEDFQVTRQKHFDVPLAAGYAKIFIGVGKMDGMGPKHILSLINNCMREHPKIDVGRVDIFTRYCLVDVDQSCADEIVSQLQTMHVRGRAVKAGFATEEQLSRGSEKKKDSKPKKYRRK